MRLRGNSGGRSDWPAYPAVTAACERGRQHEGEAGIWLKLLPCLWKHQWFWMGRLTLTCVGHGQGAPGAWPLGLGKDLQTVNPLCDVPTACSPGIYFLFPEAHIDQTGFGCFIWMILQCSSCNRHWWDYQVIYWMKRVLSWGNVRLHFKSLPGFPLLMLI